MTGQNRSQPNILGGDVDPAAEIREQIVQFVDDKAVVRDTLPNAHVQTNFDVVSSTDFRNHSVVDFLERPQALTEITWSTTQPAGTVIVDYIVPDVLFSQMITEKLSGFGAFSASVEFRVQINPHPFLMGILVLFQYPHESIIGSSRRTALLSAIDKILYLPHTKFDISKSSEAVIDIPYVSAQNMYDLTTGNYPWSRFGIMVYSPLNALAATTLDLQIWCRFKDVKLGPPTFSIMAPVGSTSDLVEQVGPEDNGPLSRPISEIGTGLSAFSRAVPSLPTISSIAETVGRAAPGLARILSSFGFSKPLDTAKPMQVLARPTAYTANADGVDASHSLSFVFDNKIPLQGHFAGSSSDELDLKYVLSVPNYIASGSYTTTSAGTVLFETFLSPTWRSESFNFGTSTAVVDVPQPTNLAYVSSWFANWRGSFVFTIRFAKCDYVSGRLAVIYSPFARINALEPVTRMDYSYKYIIDLRENTEFTFTVPYFAESDHLLVNPAFNPLTDPPPTAANYGVHSGWLGIVPLTNLQRSSALIPNSINFVVEVRAGHDFELANPTAYYWNPIVRYTSSVTEQLEEQVGDPVQAPGIRDTRTNVLQSTTDPQDITGIDRNHSAVPIKTVECFGEKVTSLREFIRRFMWSYQANTFFPPNRFLALGPPEVSVTGTAASPSFGYLLTGATVAVPDFLSIICPMYAFYTGGLNMKVYAASGTRLISCKLRAPLFTSSIAIPSAYETPTTKPIAEFSIPYYARSPKGPVTYQGDTSQTQSVYGSRDGVLINVDQSTTAPTYWVGHSTKDDFNLGYFLGPPLCADYTYINPVEILP